MTLWTGELQTGQGMFDSETNHMFRSSGEYILKTKLNDIESNFRFHAIVLINVHNNSFWTNV